MGSKRLDPSAHELGIRALRLLPDPDQDTTIVLRTPRTKHALPPKDDRDSFLWGGGGGFLIKQVV